MLSNLVKATHLVSKCGSEPNSLWFLGLKEPGFGWGRMAAKEKEKNGVKECWTEGICSINSSQCWAEWAWMKMPPASMESWTVSSKDHISVPALLPCSVWRVITLMGYVLCARCCVKGFIAIISVPTTVSMLEALLSFPILHTRQLQPEHRVTCSCS